MRLHSVSALIVVALASFAGGCQSPDVGDRCDVQWGTSATDRPPTPASIPGDYLETGNPTCDSLVCIVSPATSGEYATCAGPTVTVEPSGGGEPYEVPTQCGYCSKPCVSDTDCYKSETGLVCRQMVLDPDFILELEARDEANGTHFADQYLGAARYSRYCAVPLQ